MALNDVKILQRTDTAANWTSVNPILGPGEFGVEADTNKFKIGDGNTPWVTLAYAAGEGGTGGGLSVTGSNGQTIIWEGGATGDWIAGPNIGGYTETLDTELYDPYWDYVVWLLDFDGKTNLSTDTSGIEKRNAILGGLTFTCGTGVTFSTEQAKWGTSSLKTTGTQALDGVEQGIAELSNQRYPCTIDAWLWFDATATSSGLMGFNTSGGPNFWYASGNLTVYTDAYTLNVPYTMPKEQWIYIAVVMYDGGDEIAVYIDGSRVAYWQGTPWDDSYTVASTDKLRVLQNSGYEHKGYCSEIRFTRAARYSGSSCPVPTAKFPTQGPPLTTGYNKYSIDKHDDVDLTTGSLSNGSSLIYYETEDKWLPGPSTDRVQPDGDVLWSTVQKYHPFDQLPITENLGNNTTASLTSPSLDGATILDVTKSKFGRASLGINHSFNQLNDGLYFKYASYPFTTNQHWCVDWWQYLDTTTSTVDAIPLIVRVPGTSYVIYSLEFKYSANYGGHYYTYSYTHGQSTNTAYSYSSLTSGKDESNRLPVNEWFHCAVVYDKDHNVYRFYVNGRNWGYGSIWPSSEVPNRSDKPVDLLFCGSTQTLSQKHAYADFRISTNTQRLNIADPYDYTDISLPVQGRLTNASSGGYTIIEANKRADFVNNDAAPATATSDGKKGDIRFDSNYVYMCVSDNVWKRSALASW